MSETSDLGKLQLSSISDESDKSDESDVSDFREEFELILLNDFSISASLPLLFQLLMASEFYEAASHKSYALVLLKIPF